jgi:hypothetical protein
MPRNRVEIPTEIDSALAAALATANDALAAIKNGPLMDVTSDLCWNCNAAAACSIDDARKKIADAMEHLREAVATVVSSNATAQIPPGSPLTIMQRRPPAGRGAFGSADE